MRIRGGRTCVQTSVEYIGPYTGIPVFELHGDAGTFGVDVRVSQHQSYT